MYKKWLFVSGIIILVLGLSTQAAALDPDKALTQYMIDSWDDETGLPQNSVNALLQTNDGYIWCGTEEGLARFDGVNFTVFNEDNTPEITSNYISSLLEGSSGILWIGTQNGLLSYQNGQFTHYGKDDGFKATVVRCIAEDRQKNIWIGSDSNGLFRWDGASFTAYLAKESDEEYGLPANSIRSLFKAQDGKLWIGTSSCAAVFKNETFIHFAEGQGIPYEVVNAIGQDASGGIWLSAGRSLFRMEKNKFIESKTVSGIERPKVFAFLKDSRQNLWAATEKNGIIRIGKNGLEVLNKKNGLPDNTIRAIIEDTEGSIWVGTVYKGLVRLKDPKFTTITTREGLADNQVLPIFQDTKGYLWIGTNSGLSRYKDGKFKHFNKKHGLSNNVVDSIYEDAKGDIWVGTDNGLNRLKNTPTRITKLAGYGEGNYFLAVGGDSLDNVWGGSFQGIFKIKQNRKDIEMITAEQGLGSNFINGVYRDGKGTIWISTIRSGLSKYKEGRITVYTTKNGLAADTLLCIFEDSRSVLWFGSNSGLTRLKNGKFTSFTKKQGLFSNTIYQILEDKKSNLWFSCNKGIFRVPLTEFDEMAAGKRERVNPVVYGKADGMPTNECNGGVQSAGCKTSDGKLWFPTTRGVVWIDPENIDINEVIPPVKIEKVLLDGTETEISGGITVPPGIKRMEIHFTALSFMEPKKVFFKYKLEGYDEKWVGSGTQRAAWYTNLDGGDYNFRVIACNNDGVWNEQGAAIAIEVVPPLWRTWWFTLLALLVFAFLSYGIIHFLSKYIAMASFWKRKKYVGSFKLHDKIGSGGMGTVYKASNLRDKTETVAIKVLREEMFDDQANIKRFKQEGAIIDQLDHPNIIKIVERGVSGEYYFIAMEYLQGSTLSKKIEEDKQIDLKEGVHIMSQVASAMKKIHSKNIIHRDMKPDNVMLVKKGNDLNFVKLLDFGLAKTQYQTRLTQTGIVIGTVNYMSPEQISGKGSFPASDIYSMGIMFYEMMTGEKPYRGATTVDIMKQILDKDPIEPVRFRSDMSFDLNHLIMRMIEKDREKRPIIAEVVEELGSISNNIIKADKGL